jgi:hypothetical protein
LSVAIARVHVIESCQVCGGSISFIIGANLWSSNAINGESRASAGVTNVSGLLAILKNCSVSGSRATTSTSSGTQKNLIL